MPGQPTARARSERRVGSRRRWRPTTGASCSASAPSSNAFATGNGGHDPQQCFVVRTLLIHAYRRVLLRDPLLPAALLPLDWPGAAAYALCRDFYRLTHRYAERHLAATLADTHEDFPPAADAFYARFGGLLD